MSYNFNKYYLNSNNTEDIINNKINDNIKYKENNFENPEKKSFFSRNCWKYSSDCLNNLNEVAVDIKYAYEDVSICICKRFIRL